MSLCLAVRGVTASVWECLTLIREGIHAAYGPGDASGGGFNPRAVDVNVDYGDEKELLRLCRLLEHSVSAQGDKLHRLQSRRIRVDAVLPCAGGVTGMGAGAASGMGASCSTGRCACMYVLARVEVSLSL